MQIPQGLFWVFFFAVAIFLVGRWVLPYLASEKVGSIECPFEMKMGGGRTRLVVAREGVGASPVAQLRVRMTGAVIVHRFGNTEAKELAALLESAAARVRGP